MKINPGKPTPPYAMAAGQSGPRSASAVFSSWGIDLSSGRRGLARGGVGRVNGGRFPKPRPRWPG